MRSAAILMLTLATAAPVLAQQSAEQKKVEDAAREAVAAYAAAWNAGDAAGLADLYTVYGDYTGFGSVMSRGRDEIQKRYASLFRETFLGSQMSMDMSSLRLVGPDVAIVDGTLELASQPAAGAVPQPVKGMFIAIMTPEGGRWRFTTFWSKRLLPEDGQPDVSPR